MVLGTDFISDVLLVSLSVTAPINLLPGILSTDVALRTVSEAITKAACSILELEPNELQAEFRPALTQAGREGLEAEIYLYDTLPGGAGFSRRAGQLGLIVFTAALGILESCPENCDRSCYRCLRSYKNKFEHDLLDRQVGASLLRFLLNGTYPAIDAPRLAASTDLLFEDLRRQKLESVTIERNKQLSVPGIGQIAAPIFATRISDGAEFVIALHGPLTPGETDNESIATLKEFGAAISVRLIDEMLVRRNLPRATSELIPQIS
jgi:hypothetical protein